MLSAKDGIKIAADTIEYGAFDYVSKSESTFIKIENLIKNIRNGIEALDKIQQDVVFQKK
ncbi:MAG: hypothetical protein H0V01_09070 [Bacteroidetes bacterium]|nr:hypothetical protein [Bacteroidota bacterium]HET6244642.1 hypothetical protein [Bacteroidia bacterium]